MKIRKTTRLLLIAGLIALSATAIFYSATAVTFAVGKTPLSEFTVTKLSLTHEVVRGPEGNLIDPYEVAAVDQTSASKGHAVKAATPKKASVGKPVAAKPAVAKPPAKKPGVKKPMPTKPGPKKPSPKKPGAGKACPT